VCLGAINLLIVAFTTSHHNVAAAAWAETALSVGSVIGGLVYGARTWRATSHMRLSLLVVGLGLAVGAAGFSVNIVMLTVMVTVVGLFVSPALATAYLAADEAASPSARTQVGAWVNTGFNMGDTGGVAGLGLLVGRLPLAMCFITAGVPAVLAAVASLVQGRRNPSTSLADPVVSAASEHDLSDLID
jgi:predicted MFS family arabinose efflux permease